jgi:hypothetical protein
VKFLLSCGSVIVTVTLTTFSVLFILNLKSCQVTITYFHVSNVSFIYSSASSRFSSCSFITLSYFLHIFPIPLDIHNKVSSQCKAPYCVHLLEPKLHQCSFFVFQPTFPNFVNLYQLLKEFLFVIFTARLQIKHLSFCDCRIFPRFKIFVDFQGN